jgi:hypothetical protein
MTIRILVSVVMDIQRAGKSPPHEQNVLKNNYFEMTIEKSFKGQYFFSFLSSFLSLTANKKINSHTKNAVFWMWRRVNLV